MTAAQQDALRGLADIVAAPAVSMRPQTWTWAILAAIIAVLIALALWSWARRRAANRYRVQALAALKSLRADLSTATARSAALSQTAVLLKRTALAAYPRSDVASLSGDRWVQFLRQKAHRVPAEIATLLDDLEYRRSSAFDSISEHDVRATMDAAAQWIRKHHVSA